MTPAELLTALLLLTGAFFMFVAAVGILRMPDLYMRMSASTKSVTLGVGFTLLAATVHFDDLGIGSRALATILFVFLTAPVAAHMIARAGYARGVRLWRGTITDELREKYDAGSGELASHLDGEEGMAPAPVPPED